MRTLLKIVIEYEDQDGRILSEPFMKLPTKKELPDYYEVIRRPVDIRKILGKIDDEKYEDMDALEKDFLLLCTNTQKYNEDGSLIYEDSIVLQSVFQSARQRLEAEQAQEGDLDEGPSAPASETPSLAGGDNSNAPPSEDAPLRSTTGADSDAPLGEDSGHGKSGGGGSGKKKRRGGDGSGKGKKKKPKYVESDDEDDVMDDSDEDDD